MSPRTSAATVTRINPAADGAPPLAHLDAAHVLAALVLDDGRPWGELAHPWQWAEAEAVLTTGPAVAARTDAPRRLGPRRRFILRGRGMSKTTDVAAVVLVLLLTRAPATSRSYLYAVDADQAGLTLDAIRGLAERSGLAGLLTFTGDTLAVRQSGATLAVVAADGASDYGKRPWLAVVDELAQWPDTRNHRSLWASIVSGVAKVRSGPGLVVISTAGSPTGLGARVWESAQRSPHWHTASNPGPAPWWSAEESDATRESLTPAEWRRLILCEWAEGDDALTTAEHVAACIRSAPGPDDAAAHGYRPHLAGVGGYVAALDVGTRRDLTTLAVGHLERRDAGRVVVVDRLLTWRPGDGEGFRVDLADVEAATLRLCREYRATLRYDRMQAEQMTGNLRRQGIATREFPFTTGTTNTLARRLWGALRDHALSLPDDDELRAEALSVRLVETGPGTIKLSNPPGTHDDALTVVGMLAVDLLERPDNGRASLTVPGGAGTDALPVSRTLHDARPAAPVRSAVRQAARRQSAAQRRAGVGLVVPGSGNDPSRTGPRFWER